MLHAEQLKSLGERIVAAAKLAVQLHLQQEIDSGAKTDLQAPAVNSAPAGTIGLSDQCASGLLRQLTGRVTDDSQIPAMRRAG